MNKTIQKTILFLGLTLPVLEFAGALSAASVTATDPKEIPIDTIKAIIYSPWGSEIITQSDLDRPGFDGQQRTMDNLIFESLVYLDAHSGNLNMLIPTEEELDQEMVRIQKEHNLSSQQFDQLFIQQGYSVREAKPGFKRMKIINNVIDFKIRSNLVVPRTSIVEYYNENPVMQEAAYCLERAVIPFSTTKDMKSQRAAVNQFIASGKERKSVQWSEPFWINHSDVAADKQFICDMQPGQIRVLEDKGEFILFRLNQKRAEQLLPLEDRYQEIADLLRKPRFEELMEAYKKELYQNASIVYL